ncbi:MAG TPA: hypothetical protein VFW11_00775 [Cyclobacteriaceae bacterium]|nr:hypothetical protein [Cyclobacteriaceae bacterium]
MEEKINLKAIAQYSEEYSGKVLDSFFSKQSKIAGSEILTLCELRQINLFVIYELFKAWREETDRTRSPFFDYSAGPVKEAMEAMMTTLSNHIAIDRPHFTPLLKKATYNTLLLIVDPYDFYADLIEGQNDQITVDLFRKQLKYLKINRAPLERLLQKLEQKNVATISGNEAFAMLDTILEEVNFTPEDIDEYLTKFSTVAPVSIDRFYEQKLQPERKEQPVTEKVKAETSPYFTPSPVSSPQTKPTINEKLAQEPRPTLADNFNKISRIKESLTINQKFMFTKVLFHGDFELFSKAIDDLDRQDNLQGALRYLEQNYEEWDRESEEFHEFMELVEKRFNN